MIYFFYGTDDFRLYERVNQIKLSSNPLNQPMDYGMINAEDIGPADFEQIMLARSLFAKHKLIVIRNVVSQGSVELQAKLLGWLKESDPDFILIFTENNIPRIPREQQLLFKTPIFRTLNQFLVERFMPLNHTQVRQWLSKKAAELKLELAPDAAACLLKDFNGDLWRINQELSKLAAFIGGSGKVDAETVKWLVPGAIVDDIFQTIEALAKRNLALANYLINHQLAVGTREQELIAMIAYQFRNIILIKTLSNQGLDYGEILIASRMHPYALEKTTQLTNNFTPHQLSKIFQLLAKIDLAIKQGKIIPHLGIDLLMVQIARV